MTFKEKSHINHLFNKIKLDHSGTHPNLTSYREEADEDKRQNEKYPENEWNQEYEMIYLSYVLEK